MAEPTQHQIDSLLAAFGSFTRRFKVAEAEAAADNALNAVDQAALIFVAEHPGTGLSEVARYLNVAMTTMSSAADRLVKKGLIDRQRLEEDRRSIALVATPNGQAIVERHAAMFRDLCRIMLSRLDETERADWIRLATKISSHEP